MLPVCKVINGLEEPGTNIGPVSIPDGFNQKITQPLVAKQLAENVKHAAAERAALLFDFFKEALEYIALASFVRHEIPKVANFGLTDAMNSAKPLFKAVRVPWDVVIDHQMCALEVNTFTRSVGRHEYLDTFVLSESLLCISPLFSPDSAMNRYNGLWPSQ